MLTATNYSKPFVMVSAAAGEIREAALAAGAVAVFGKSGSADELLEAIAAALIIRS